MIPKFTRFALLAVVCLTTQVVHADNFKMGRHLRIWNLDRDVIYVATSYLDNKGYWVTSGWQSVYSRSSFVLEWPANKTQHVLIHNSKGENLGQSRDGVPSQSFWIDPKYGHQFRVSERSGNPSEVYLRGVRVTTAALKSQGFQYVQFIKPRIEQQSGEYIWQAGTYWKVGGQIEAKFKYTTAGMKTEEYFSSNKDPIIDFIYQIQDARNVKVGANWHFTSDHFRIHRNGPDLAPYNPARGFNGEPLYYGKVTGYKTYH